MKKLLLVIALLAISPVNAKLIQRTETNQQATPAMTRARRAQAAALPVRNVNNEPFYIAQNDFEVLMRLDFHDSKIGPQYAINRSWDYWTEHQRQDILLRLWDLGFLSEKDVVYWQGKLGERNKQQKPQVDFVAIGG